MTLSADDVKTIISIFAIFVSIFALHLTRANWRESNRPIVLAFIAENWTGSQAGGFDLVVTNSGNRPAVRVRLHATRRDIRSLVERDANSSELATIENCFLPESEISILKNGESLSTCFGAYLAYKKEGKWLNYGAQIEIRITYLDLGGRKFQSKMPLRIYARDGFGGSVWSSDPKK